MPEWLVRLVERRRRPGGFQRVPDWARPLLAGACRDLSAQEGAMQRLLGLVESPGLVLADEELSILVDEAERHAIEREESPPEPPRER